MVAGGTSARPRPVMSDTEPAEPAPAPAPAPAKPPAPKEMQKILAEKRMAQQQAQVDEVVGIMR